MLPQTPFPLDLAVITAARLAIDVVPVVGGSGRLAIFALAYKTKIDEEPGQPLAEPGPPRVWVSFVHHGFVTVVRLTTRRISRAHSSCASAAAAC